MEAGIVVLFCDSWTTVTSQLLSVFVSIKDPAVNGNCVNGGCSGSCGRSRDHSSNESSHLHTVCPLKSFSYANLSSHTLGDDVAASLQGIPQHLCLLVVKCLCPLPCDEADLRKQHNIAAMMA